MILMRRAMQERLLLRIDASSEHGDGTFYLTDRAVAYEVQSQGIYLNFIPHKNIKKLTGIGGMLGARKLRMEWDEGAAVHAFEFRTRQHASLLEAARKAGIL